MKKIKCMFMRAGTSRGPFLDLRDLPADESKRNEILLKIMGSPDKRQIDGIGGATSVASKAAMVRPSKREGIDVDYLLAQVFIDVPVVDTKPTCGNMMAGVAPFAIERGWVRAGDPETKVTVYNINTDSVIEVIVQTPGGEVNYTEGDLEISGVPGTGAPILMNLFGISGGATGKLFPTGNLKDLINGMEVSIVDAGNMTMLLSARSLGLSGSEGPDFFMENKKLMEKIAATRIEAGKKCGLGEVNHSVIPKVSILSPPTHGGTIRSQYFTPHEFHHSHAVSGAICIATACKATGTIASEIANISDSSIETIVVEHRTGTLPVQIETSGSGHSFHVEKAGVLRTARKIMDGEIFY